MNSLLFTLVMLAAVAVMAAIALLLLNYIATEPKAAPETGRCAAEPTIQALRTCLRRLRQREAVTDEAYANHCLRLLAVQAAIERGQSAPAQQALAQFIREIGDQAGKQIEIKQARHLAQHAQLVAQALEQRQQSVAKEARDNHPTDPGAGGFRTAANEGG